MMTFYIPKNKFHIPESLEINLAGVPECFFEPIPTPRNLGVSCGMLGWCLFDAQK